MTCFFLCVWWLGGGGKERFLLLFVQGSGCCERFDDDSDVQCSSAFSSIKVPSNPRRFHLYVDTRLFKELSRGRPFDGPDQRRHRQGVAQSPDGRRRGRRRDGSSAEDARRGRQWRRWGREGRRGVLGGRRAADRVASPDGGGASLPSGGGA